MARTAAHPTPTPAPIAALEVRLLDEDAADDVAAAEVDVGFDVVVEADVCIVVCVGLEVELVEIKIELTTVPSSISTSAPSAKKLLELPQQPYVVPSRARFEQQY
jgi:hypothetical protein